MPAGDDDSAQAVPAYAQEWDGHRVSWGKRGPGERGVVISSSMAKLGDKRTVVLRVATDSGFVAPGVPADSARFEEVQQ